MRKTKPVKESKMKGVRLKPEQMAEIWTRNIQTTPSEFLRLQFMQHAEVRQITN